MKRKNPTSSEKIAALVLTLKVEDKATGELVPLVTREEAKMMTAEQICSLLQWDHWPVPVAVAIPLGWSPREYNHPTNLDAKPILAHRVKTATKDVPEIAKGDRIAAEQAEFRRRLLVKQGAEAPPPAPKIKRAWPKRSFAQQRGQKQ